MLRVLHFADIINRDDFIHNVLSHCDPRAFRMSAITLQGRGSFNAQPGSIPVTDLGIHTRREYLRAMLELRSLVSRDRPDILHSHHFEPSLLAAVASRHTGTKLVIGRHYSDSIYRQSRGLRQWVYLRLEAYCNTRARRIVVPSRFVEEILLRQGVPPAKVVRIPYGFDFSRLVPSSAAAVDRCRSLWAGGPGLRLATVGRCHQEKGQRYLLQAIAALARAGLTVRLLVVGDGPDHAALEREVELAGLADRVRFAGWRTDVLDVMAAADGIVQPTLGEAFSQVMVEAMALGCPLIISDVGGVADVVEENVSGLVVPPADSQALANAIGRLNDGSLRGTLGEHARTRVISLLDLRRTIAQFEGLYQSVALET